MKQDPIHWEGAVCTHGKGLVSVNLSLFIQTGTRFKWIAPLVSEWYGLIFIDSSISFWYSMTAGKRNVDSLSMTKLIRKISLFNESVTFLHIYKTKIGWMKWCFLPWSLQSGLNDWFIVWTHSVWTEHLGKGTFLFEKGPTPYSVKRSRLMEKCLNWIKWAWLIKKGTDWIKKGPWLYYKRQWRNFCLKQKLNTKEHYFNTVKRKESQEWCSYFWKQSFQNFTSAHFSKLK